MPHYPRYLLFKHWDPHLHKMTIATAESLEILANRDLPSLLRGGKLISVKIDHPILVKSGISDQNRNFGENSKFRLKMEILDKNLNFDQKWKIWSKIKILAKKIFAKK